MAEQESRLSIVIDSASAEARIKELRKQLRELGGAADQAADDTGDLGNRADRASRDTNRLNASAASGKKALDGMAKAAALAGVALVGGLGLAINKAQSFETAMAEVNKTVDFAASDGLANLKNELLELSKTIPLTFEELAAVAASGGQLGVAEKDIASFTETVSKMAIAFDMSADDAGDAMAKLANVFVIPISEIDRLGDAINTLSNNSPAKASEIVNAMSRVGGMANAFGLSADATAALTSSFIAMGKPAEVAASAVNSMLTTFSTLDMATKSQILGFDKLGVNIDEFAQRVKVDGKAAIYEFLEAVNELPQADRIGAIASIMGKEFGDDVTMLAGNMGLLEDQMRLVGETADSTKNYFGSMDAEFVKISATSANKMTLFKSNIDALVASVGEAFIPALNDLLLNITPLVATMGTWVAENQELVKQIVVVTGVLLTSIVSLKLFADGVMAVKDTVAGLKLAFSAAKAGLAILTGSIGLPLLAIGALIAAGVLLYQNWDYVKEKASELNEYIKGVFGSLPEPLQQAGRDIAQIFMFIWNTGKEYLTLMGELYSGTFESFKTIATGAFQVIWSVIKVSFSGIVNTVSTALQVVATLFSGGFALIKNTVSTVLGVIKAVISGDFKAIPGIIGNGLKGAISIVGNMMGQILDVIKNYGKKLYSIGRDFIQGFINGIKSIGSGVVSAASTMAGNAIEAVKKRQQSNSPAKATIKLGKDLGQGYVKGIKSKAKAVKTEAQKMAEGAIEAVQTGIDRIKKELALFGNNSNLADLEYDIKIGKYDSASDAKKNEYRNVTAELEAKTKLAAANKSVQDSIDGLMKQQTLFGNNSSLASLMYDIEHTDKYKDATTELTDKLIEQTRALEQLSMTAKATAAIQARFAQLGKDREASNKAVDGVMGELVNESPLGKIEADYARRLEIITTNEMLETGIIGSEVEKRLAIEQSYQDAKRNLMLTQGEALFGDLAGLAKGFAGEQSGIYKAMFAVEKGFAIAQSAMAIQQSIAKAMAVGFPANIPLIGQAISQGAGIISSIKGITTGFKQGGYTGSMGVNQVAGAVHGQEYVFDAKSTREIGVGNLEAIRRGKAPSGDVSINIINNSVARVDTSSDGKTITISDVRREARSAAVGAFTELQNPNSHSSKMIKQSVQAPRRR